MTNSPDTALKAALDRVRRELASARALYMLGARTSSNMAHDLRTILAHLDAFTEAGGGELGVPLAAGGAPITSGPGLGWKLSDVARDKIMELVAENVHNAGALHGIVLASLSVAQPTPDAIAERARREWEKLRPAPFYGSEFRIIEKEEVLAILQRQVAGA